ncbi:unnamed protein product [Symbiodinium pilosum]|uniref:Uncharacterized protein n=1 Tax=Symbiodinium pilosum TaxID=2952 RepID=A0A812WLD1_SYMPI|nr:unnamed protein product [Symbiodinium pilosum]
MHVVNSLRFFVCPKAPRTRDVSLPSRYREFVLAVYALTAVDAAARRSVEEAEEVELLEESTTAAIPGLPPPEVLDVEEFCNSKTSGTGRQPQREQLEIVDVETPLEAGDQSRAVALLAEEEEADRESAVAEALKAMEATNAAEDEVEAIMEEEDLRRALLDPEGEARRRRVQARKSHRGQRWNFAGRAARWRCGDDRFREHEVDLECRRKLAFRARGRFQGAVEDRGDERQDGNLKKQKEARVAPALAQRGDRGAGPVSAVKSITQPQERKRTCLGRSSAKANDSIRRGKGCQPGRPKRLRLPPIDFPELPIVIADEDRQELLPEARTRNLPMVIQIDRECRQARASELQKMRDDLTTELQVARKERHDAAKDLRECCVAEAQAVEELRDALKAAFGSLH